MTSFEFRLQRVLDFRRMQFQVAESECHRAAANLHALQSQQAALALRKSETRSWFARLPEAHGRELAPLPGWYRWTVTEREHLLSLERLAAQELEKKRAGLIEARRRVRLLETLREHQLAQWQRESDRELEEISADAMNSRHSRGDSI